jgi:hypothetical protein
MGDSRDRADSDATKPPRISPTKPESTRETAEPRMLIRKVKGAAVRQRLAPEHLV